VVQIRVTPKTRNPFTIKALSISGVTWKWHFLNHAPVSFLDKALLNGRNIVETIIGHIKEFSSLRFPKHRSVCNAFTHLTAALVAYQINPLPPKPIGASIP
jgi:hypothetical protein